MGNLVAYFNNYAIDVKCTCGKTFTFSPGRTFCECGAQYQLLIKEVNQNIIVESSSKETDKLQSQIEKLEKEIDSLKQENKNLKISNTRLKSKKVLVEEPSENAEKT